MFQHPFKLIFGQNAEVKQSASPAAVDIILFILFICHRPISRLLGHALQTDITQIVTLLAASLFLVAFIVRLASRKIDLLSFLFLFGTLITLLD